MCHFLNPFIAGNDIRRPDLTYIGGKFASIHIMYYQIQKADRPAIRVRTTLFQSQIIKGLKKRTIPKNKQNSFTLLQSNGRDIGLCINY